MEKIFYQNPLICTQYFDVNLGMLTRISDEVINSNNTFLTVRNTNILKN